MKELKKTLKILILILFVVLIFVSLFYIMIFSYWLFISILIIAILLRLFYSKIFIKNKIYEKKEYLLIKSYNLIKNKLVNIEIKYKNKSDLKKIILEAIKKMNSFSKKEKFVMFYDQENSSDEKNLEEIKKLVNEKITKKEKFDAIIDQENNVLGYKEIKVNKIIIEFSGSQKFLEHISKKY